MHKPNHPDAHPGAHTAHAAQQHLRVRGLAKRFAGKRVLQDLDLDVGAGELVAVLGPSGSGKTTLLRLICGFEHVDAGTIDLGTRRVADNGRLRIPPEKRGIGYVAQEGALFPHLSVADNIAFGLRRVQRRQVPMGALLEMVGLPADYAKRSPGRLSGGEQQRVALARALAPGPGLVLLDEPFTALDAGLRADTRAAAVNSLHQTGASAILVTHDQNEALSMGDRVAVLQDGRFAQVAEPHSVYRHPATPHVARFVGNAVLVPGEAGHGRVQCNFGDLMLAGPVAGLHGAVQVLVRPEQFCIGAAAGDSALRARVERLDFHGHDADVFLRLADDTLFSAVLPGALLPEPGQQVAVRVTGMVHAYPQATA